MTDIRHYSDEELSLQFLNDQPLYETLMAAVRRNDFSIVKDLCDEYFIYNEEQMEDFRATFNLELEEYEN